MLIHKSNLLEYSTVIFLSSTTRSIQILNYLHTNRTSCVLDTSDIGACIRLILVSCGNLQKFDMFVCHIKVMF